MIGSPLDGDVRKASLNDDMGGSASMFCDNMDDPTQTGSLTRRLYEMNKLPCMNTGGNVGTTAWIFANSIELLLIVEKILNVTIPPTKWF